MRIERNHGDAPTQTTESPSQELPDEMILAIFNSSSNNTPIIPPQTIASIANSSKRFNDLSNDVFCFFHNKNFGEVRKKYLAFRKESEDILPQLREVFIQNESNRHDAILAKTCLAFVVGISLSISLDCVSLLNSVTLAIVCYLVCQLIDNCFHDWRVANRERDYLKGIPQSFNNEVIQLQNQQSLPNLI